MKQLIRLIGIAFCFAMALCASAQSSVYSAQSLMAAGTNGVGANTTTTYSTSAYVVDVRKQKNTAILLSFTCGGTNASTITLTWERSLDGSFYDTTSTFVHTVAANGTNTVTVGTNITLNGWGYYRLKTIANPNATVGLTNITLQYSIKQAD